MPIHTMSMIYLGNLPDLDPTDGNGAAENQALLMGSYYDSSDPAASHIVDVTVNDSNSSGTTQSNDAGGNPEVVTYDLGGGLVSTHYDSLLNVDVRIEFGSATGAPDYTGLGGVVQTETGDTFLVMIDDDVGLGANNLDDFPINSITINSVSAFGADQWIDASDDEQFVPCFTAHTMIRTARGELPASALRPDDLVETLDNGMQPVVWLGRRRLGWSELQRNQKLWPVHIAPNALGDGYPKQDLFLSPQHRILIKSRIAERMFGRDEVLIPCIQAVGLPGISRYYPPFGVQYYHFLCEDHQLVWADGAACETLYLGPQGLRSLTPDARSEVTLLMPDFARLDTGVRRPAVRHIVRDVHRWNRFLERHQMNHKGLVSI